MKRIDANVILRYLLDDHAKLSRKAGEIIEKENIFVSFEVICEVVYVLGGVYGVDRKNIASTLNEFIQFKNVASNNVDVLLSGLKIFAQNKLDFVDALLCAYNIVAGDSIMTFDNKIISFLKGVHK